MLIGQTIVVGVETTTYPEQLKQTTSSNSLNAELLLGIIIFVFEPLPL